MRHVILITTLIGAAVMLEGCGCGLGQCGTQVPVPAGMVLTEIRPFGNDSLVVHADGKTLLVPERVIVDVILDGRIQRPVLRPLPQLINGEQRYVLIVTDEVQKRRLLPFWL